MGMFAKGLVKGLAGSIDKNLQMAMARRQDDVSRAKSFWMTRQAQKLDAAEEHDRMAEKHLNRLINEFGGDVAKGLAAYKAIGGDVDTVGQYIKDLDETRQVGIKYNIADKFKFDGIDLSQFADLSKKQALSAVGMEVKPLDIQYTDTSGLARLGLGFKDKGKEISESINQLIPAKDLTEIRNITSSLKAKFDPSGLKAGVEFDMAVQTHAMSMQANAPSLEKQLAKNVQSLIAETDPDKRKKLLEDQTVLLSAIEDYENLTNKTNLVGMSTLLSAYNSGLTNLKTEKGYKNTSGLITLTNPTGGPLLQDQEALDAWSEMQKTYDTNFIKNSLLSADGKSYLSNKTQALASVMGLREMAESMIATANETIDTEGDGAGGGEPPPSDDPKDKFTPEYVNNSANDYANAKEFLQFAETQLPAGQKMEYQRVINNLTTTFGLPLDVAERLAEPYKDKVEDIINRRTTDNTALIQALKNKFGNDVVADDGSVMSRPTLKLSKVYSKKSQAFRQDLREKQQIKIDAWDDKFAATHNPDGSLKTFK